MNRNVKIHNNIILFEQIGIPFDFILDEELYCQRYHLHEINSIIILTFLKNKLSYFCFVTSLLNYFFS